MNNNSKTILEICTGNIKIVKFNNPKRKNAIDANMYLRVTSILTEAAKDTDISTLVLTGVGDYYSSGNDLFASAEMIAKKDTSLLPILKDYINAFIQFPKILVGVVNGPAIGIAATTLALCDLVFAAENSFFYTPFSKLGLVAEGCSTYTFPRIMGDRKAAEMLLFSHRMSAKEALQYGFVNYVYKPEEIQSEVWDKINEYSQLSQGSLTASKRLLRTNINELIKTNNSELDELHKIWMSEDYVNNLVSFVNKKSKM